MVFGYSCKKELLEKDLTGQVIIVTGANSGIGKVTATQLVKQGYKTHAPSPNSSTSGASVILACRRVKQGKTVAESFKNLKGQHEVLELDLSSFDSIRAFVKEFKAKYDRLNVLVNNAGVMNTPKKKTKDGFEFQFGVNYLGHFLLTELLKEVLISSAPSRVVNVSSCYSVQAVGNKGHIWFEKNFLDPDTTGSYNGWLAYAQSKLANCLHARHLAKLLREKNVSVVSLHPGFVYSNLLNPTMPKALQYVTVPGAVVFAGMIMPWKGAQTSLFCILDDSIPENTGKFFSQGHSPAFMYSMIDFKLNSGGWPMKHHPNPEAEDDTIAERLYNQSLTMVGLIPPPDTKPTEAQDKGKKEVSSS